MHPEVVVVVGREKIDPKNRGVAVTVNQSLIKKRDLHQERGNLKVNTIGRLFGIKFVVQV